MNALKHSIIPPSSAARRIACPGSRAMEEPIADVPTPESIEGDLAHEVLHLHLTAWWGEKKTGVKTGCLDVPGATQEMYDGAALVEQYLEMREGITMVGFESKVLATNIHAESWGTVDVWAYQASDKTLTILDYKFGHRYVEAFENAQLQVYALGVIETYLSGVHSQDIWTINLVIAQPRCFQEPEKIRLWQMDRLSLLRFRDKMADVEVLALTSDAPCIPNPECRDCKAKAVCGALQNTAMAAITPASKQVSRELNPVELGHELKFLGYYKRLLDARLDGLEKEALVRIQQKEAIPGFRATPKETRRVWSKPLKDIADAAEYLGCGRIIKTPSVELMTPAQALKAGAPLGFVEGASVKPQGEWKLQEVDEDKEYQKLFGGA